MCFVEWEDPHVKRTGVFVVPLGGFKKCFSLGTSVVHSGAFAVPCRVLSWKTWLLILSRNCTSWYKGEKKFKPSPQNRIVISLGVLCKISHEYPRPFDMGSPPDGCFFLIEMLESSHLKWKGEILLLPLNFPSLTAKKLKQENSYCSLSPLIKKRLCCKPSWPPSPPPHRNARSCTHSSSRLLYARDVARCVQ